MYIFPLVSCVQVLIVLAVFTFGIGAGAIPNYGRRKPEFVSSGTLHPTPTFLASTFVPSLILASVLLPLGRTRGFLLGIPFFICSTEHRPSPKFRPISLLLVVWVISTLGNRFHLGMPKNKASQPVPLSFPCWFACLLTFYFEAIVLFIHKIIFHLTSLKKNLVSTRSCYPPRSSCLMAIPIVDLPP